MIAWEWNIDKAREEEESDKKKAAARKISQTAQVQKTDRHKQLISLCCVSKNVFFIGHL